MRLRECTGIRNRAASGNRVHGARGDAPDFGHFGCRKQLWELRKPLFVGVEKGLFIVNGANGPFNQFVQVVLWRFCWHVISLLLDHRSQGFTNKGSTNGLPVVYTGSAHPSIGVGT